MLVRLDLVPTAEAEGLVEEEGREDTKSPCPNLHVGHITLILSIHLTEHEGNSTA